MEAHPPPAVHDLFAPAFRKFERTRDWLCAQEQAHASHAVIEAQLLTDVRELGRLLMQAHADLRTEREKPLPAPASMSEQARPRLLARNLDTVLGTVRVGRIAWQVEGAATVIPLDRALAMPARQYSFGVQRFVAEQAETMSFERSGVALHGFGLEVPKRQREQLVVGMARDFADFYAQRARPANDVAGVRTLLLMSADSVGVRVLPSSLREATRKEAERAAQEVIRGDPMAARVGHTHDRRMAVVT